MDYLDTFSQFAAGITYESLGSDVHEQVGWILADTVGAMVAGSAEPELRALATRQAPGASAVLVGLGRRTGAETAAFINGTSGTDHGTGTLCFLAGGALKGGRVLADWPGLGEAQLFERRDLAPTTDLRAVLKGVLEGHLGLSPAALSKTVFPGSDAVRPMKGLLA